MYYDWDESCVPDRVYDMVSRQLVGLRNKYPEEYKRTTYYYAMVDFDGSTGFDIPSRLTDSDDKYLRQISTTVYKQWKAKGGKTKR